MELMLLVCFYLFWKSREDYWKRKETEMNRDEINEAISDILMQDGPDGHTDGDDVITDFVMALLSGKGEEWIRCYRAK